VTFEQQSRIELNAFWLGVQITNIDVGVLERMTAHRRPLTRVADPNLDGTPRREVDSPVQAHHFLERGLAQPDAEVAIQVSLNAEPSGKDILLLQSEYGRDGAKVDLAMKSVRRVRIVEQARLFMDPDFLLAVEAAHPLADGDSGRAHQHRDRLLAPPLRAQADHLQAARLRVGGYGVVDEIAELRIAPEEVA
jgi:hypothetical protein